MSFKNNIVGGDGKGINLKDSSGLIYSIPF